MPEQKARRWIAAILALAMGQGAASSGDSSTTSAVSNAVATAWTERYVYDALGRLRRVTFANGAVTSYTIDKAGNRTAVNTTVP